MTRDLATMQHLSTKADYHCSPKAEWRSCSTTLKNLWIPSRVVISYKLLLSCTFCHTKQINMRLAYILSFYICQLSMAIKRSRRRENKAMAKDRPWTPWITPRPEHLLEEGKAGFLVSKHFQHPNSISRPIMFITVFSTVYSNCVCQLLGHIKRRRHQQNGLFKN